MRDIALFLGQGQLKKIFDDTDVGCCLENGSRPYMPPVRSGAIHTHSTPDSRGISVR